MTFLIGLLTIGILGIALMPSNPDSWDDDESSVSETPSLGDRETNENGAHVADAPAGEDERLDGRSGEAMQEQEWLIASVGEDTLVAGPNDVLFGGDGDDVFDVMMDEVAYIQDYEDGEVIIISYDGAPPRIDYDVNDDGIAILANGYPVAMLQDVYDFSPSDILLSHISEA